MALKSTRQDKYILTNLQKFPDRFALQSSKSLLHDVFLSYFYHAIHELAGQQPTPTKVGRTGSAHMEHLQLRK